MDCFGQEFVPRGRQAVEEHPGPPAAARSPNRANLSTNEHLLSFRLKNVNISSEPKAAEPQHEDWMFDEVYEGAPMMSEFLVNSEHELYYKGHTAVWTRGVSSATGVLPRTCFTCDTPIRHAFFCKGPFIRADESNRKVQQQLQQQQQDDASEKVQQQQEADKKKRKSGMDDQMKGKCGPGEQKKRKSGSDDKKKAKSGAAAAADDPKKAKSERDGDQKKSQPQSDDPKKEPKSEPEDPKKPVTQQPDGGGDHVRGICLIGKYI